MGHGVERNMEGFKGQGLQKQHLKDEKSKRTEMVDGGGNRPGAKEALRGM